MFRFLATFRSFYFQWYFAFWFWINQWFLIPLLGIYFKATKYNFEIFASRLWFILVFPILFRKFFLLFFFLFKIANLFVHFQLLLSDQLFPIQYFASLLLHSLLDFTFVILSLDVKFKNQFSYFGLHQPFLEGQNI